jgi:predicted enzyme related to lactoylglutathione lyase
VDGRVGELVEAGATVRDIRADPEHGFYGVVMLDPEGNEFCVA